jgi:hypothetical protein
VGHLGGMLGKFLAEDVCPFGAFFNGGTFPGKVKEEAKLSRQKAGARQIPSSWGA